MNFKLLLVLIMLGGCGVKGEPVSPEGRPLPSFLENYPDIELDKTINEHQRLRP